MRIGNLAAGGGALRQSLKILRLRWEQTRSQWDDQMSQEFEEKYLLELEHQCHETAEQISRLAQVLTKCYQDCNE